MSKSPAKKTKKPTTKRKTLTARAKPKPAARKPGPKQRAAPAKTTGKKAAAKALSLAEPTLAAPCPVSAIPAITDRLALRMENGERLLWDNTAAGLKSAAEKLVKAIREEKDGSAVITSAYRPQAYQDHLKGVWDRARQLQGNTSPDCELRRREVRAEMNKHVLKVDVPVAATSNHTAGRAVDIDWNLPNAVDPNARVAELAKSAGLSHPLPDSDPVHFVLS